MALPYSRRAFTKLAKLLKESEDEKVQLAAAREILDRAYGRPQQSQEITGAEGQPLMPPAEIDDAEVARRLAFVLRRGGADG